MFPNNLFRQNCQNLNQKLYFKQTDDVSFKASILKLRFQIKAKKSK